MPIAINAPGHTRTDVFNVDPSDVIVREELRGRAEPPTEEAIINMALSIHTRGQIQPGRGRKLKHEDNRIELVAGFTRYAAVRLLRDGFEHEGVFHHEPTQRYRVEVSSDLDNVQALKFNIAENLDRSSTTAIDDAHNIRRLRNMGEDDSAIAALFHRPVGWVEKTVELLALAPEERAMVSDGTLPVTTAHELLTVAPEERKEVIAAAPKTAKGKVKGEGVRKIIRDKHLTNQPASGKPTVAPKNIARPFSDVKAFFEAECLRDDHGSAFAKAFVGYCAGTAAEGKLKEAFDKLVSHGG